jgi:hypothetical protein
MAVPMRPDDPAYWMLQDEFTSTPVVHRRGCYICEDPEFAQMGLPLCRPCPQCRKTTETDGHIAADDSKCDVCGFDDWNPGEDEPQGPPPEPTPVEAERVAQFPLELRKLFGPPQASP